MSKIIVNEAIELINGFDDINNVPLYTDTDSIII